MNTDTSIKRHFSAFRIVIYVMFIYSLQVLGYLSSLMFFYFVLLQMSEPLNPHAHMPIDLRVQKTMYKKSIISVHKKANNSTFLWNFLVTAMTSYIIYYTATYISRMHTF